MEKERCNDYSIMEVCLLAGKIMLENGAETYRVEDTMTRMAYSLGGKESQSYVTPTAIIFSIEGEEPTKTKLVRITERTTDLKKVSEVNSISRRLAEGHITLEEAYSNLKEVERSTAAYSMTYQVLAAAVASGCCEIMFRGTWFDFIPTVIVGGLGFISSIFIHRVIHIRFFAEFASSLIIGLFAYLFVFLGIGLELDKIIIGSVMPLVPGLILTNAIRDLMAGHLVAGVSRGAEALLTACAIGSGVAAVLLFVPA